MERNNLSMLLHQHLRLSEAFVERDFLFKSVCKSHTGHCRRDGILCHLESQIAEIDLIHISHNLFAFYGLRDNDSCSDFFAGLFCVKAKCRMLTSVPNKGLTLSETVSATLTAKPNKRLILRQI